MILFYGVKDRRERLEVKIENFKDLLKRGHCASNSAIGPKKVSILVKCRLTLSQACSSEHQAEVKPSTHGDKRAQFQL